MPALTPSAPSGSSANALLAAPERLPPKRTGGRKITAAMLAARAARPSTWEDVSKLRARRALERAAVPLDLPAKLIMLVLYLVRLTQDGDWAPGGRLIAWPSNLTLCRHLAINETQLQALIRRGQELGLFEMDDSGDGKRWGVRADGRHGPIVTARGFDLTALAARCAEFERLADQYEAELREGDRLFKQITATWKRVQALTNAALEQSFEGHDWQTAAHDARTLYEKRGRRRDIRVIAPIAHRLTLLVATVEEAVSAASKSSGQTVETEPKDPENRGHNTTTNSPPIDESITSTAGLTPLAQEKPRSPPPLRSPFNPPSVERPSALRGFVVTPGFLMLIAGAFRDHVRTSRPGWGDIYEAVDGIRSSLGISRHAWGQACVVLGRMEATTALAVIAARHEAGLVRSPGGLLGFMVEAYQEGTLRLDKTLFGLADVIDTRRY